MTNGVPSLVPTIHALSTGAFSMNAGDLMELQLMNLRINDGRYDGSCNTSAGFRRAHEPDQPQNLLALLAPITLLSHEATPHIRSITCAHRTQARPSCWRPLSMCFQAVPHGWRKAALRRSSHPLSVCRAACPLHMYPWGWDRRGGALEAGLGSSTVVCYALLCSRKCSSVRCLAGSLLSHLFTRLP